MNSTTSLDFTSPSMNCSMLINVHPVLRRRLLGGDSAPRYIPAYVAYLRPIPKGRGCRRLWVRQITFLRIVHAMEETVPCSGRALVACHVATDLGEIGCAGAGFVEKKPKTSGSGRSSLQGQGVQFAAHLALE